MGGGGLQSDMAFSPHGKVEVTVFSFEKSVPVQPRGGGGDAHGARTPGSLWVGRGSVPPPGLSPHTGRAAAACSGSRGPGRRRGQVCCSPTLLLAASGPIPQC